LLDVAPTLLEAAGGHPPASFEGELLPHDDASAAAQIAPDRTIFAEDGTELAVIRGGEYAAMPRRASGAERAPDGHTATLWPGGDRSAERLPKLDRGQAARERLARLRPLLAGFDPPDELIPPASAAEPEPVPEPEPESEPEPALP
jgi:arylsulfatase A-like enzyme